MAKISIVGAGDVGASIAYTMLISALATEIVLIDTNSARAEGHALDMNHGLFFTSPARIRSGSYPDAEGSDVVVITAGSRQKENETRLELTKRNAAIVREIMRGLGQFVGESKVIVITNPVDVMTSVAQTSYGGDPRRVIGSGTVLDSARFRYELSHRCAVDPRNVHAYVVGEHGDSEVFLWSQVRIAGVELEWFCRGCEQECSVEHRPSIEAAVRESAYHLIETKGYTNYAVSLAVRRIIGAILRNESSVLTVSARMNGEYGLSEICLSVPCIVNTKGVVRVIETRLVPEELEAFHRSARVVGSAVGLL